ncbi:MAG TPA: hypothetical protein PLB89_00180 [Flavobacteriales bacterium]|nr:hypothetical protein [Flavobacteriales bacterium]
MPDQRNSMLERYRAPRRTQHQHRGVEGMAKEQTWPGTWMVFGIFVLLVSFWWVGSRTFITYTALGRWFALFAFIGNLLPYKKVGLRLGMERLEWFLFNLLAVGPFVFSIALWLNLGVHGPERLYYIHSDSPYLDVRRHWLEHGALPANTYLGTPADEAASEQVLREYEGHQLLGVSPGCLGYDVISRWEGRED